VGSRAVSDIDKFHVAVIAEQHDLPLVIGQLLDRPLQFRLSFSELSADGRRREFFVGLPAQPLFKPSSRGRGIASYRSPYSWRFGTANF